MQVWLWIHFVATWLHVVAVCLWVGTTVAFLFLVVPVIKKMSPAHGSEVLDWVGTRSRWLVLGLILVFLLSGTVNLYYRGMLTSTLNWHTYYGKLLGFKLLLVGGLFLVFPVYLLVFGGPRRTFEHRLTQSIRLHWVLLVWSLVVVFLGIMLRG